MTIRVPAQIQTIDARRLAAVLTRAVLNPTLDDVPVNVRESRPGAAWVQWGDTQNLPTKVRHPLD